ncbi:NAD(P)/FAD-dependent oxidoreductase [Bosea sp. TND4EK4]|uniref:NAD(P)/FAD-dependent oxidoreductase n=1 Tax=Bosea sp. TND4EK4 TaxID=1907408 RepID=UPI0009546AF2|nr:NAD(P)/FAD-dependent oxidoreductase [Bosea sp. TND4EK4]SIR21207.1 NADPH-dependent 2,4-dienoyl-CoA reductase, sulfur reductase [Bosea sp. TND4EK4]
MIAIDDISALSSHYDLVVVGAGPAGLSAAARAADLGLSVLLADENPAPGGQIYRAVTTTPVVQRDILGEDYWLGAGIAARFERSVASYAARCTVWALGPDETSPGAFELGLSLGSKARMISAAQVILATGAQERPFPIPGWTLPGVMTAGAAQIALKSAGIVPAGRTAIAGCGPLLYLLAGQLAAAGTEIVAVLDTTPRANWAKALAALPDFLRSPYLAKGLKLMAKARRSLRFVSGVTGLAAQGDRQLSGVRIVRGSTAETLACDTLLLHQGVIPSVNLASAAGCALDFDETQHAFVPRVDAWFASSVGGIAIAGDGAGIGGAESAALRGEIAAFDAARKLGRLSEAERDRQAAPFQAELTRRLRGRRFLDLLYKPAAQFLAPPADETIVCRCEEVTAGQVRDAASRLGVTGPNQMKAFLRCGMGPCQGRLCGPTVVELIAQTRGTTPAETGYYRLRPPVKPVTLAELAALPPTDEATKAVVR